MTTFLTPATITRLEKAAVDNGFDVELPHCGLWLSFASTQAPLRLWLTIGEDGLYLVALSQANVARALGREGVLTTTHLPPEAVEARALTDIPTLHRLVRRAFQLSKALPDELLHAFHTETAAMPRATEADRFVIQRVGQDVFRRGLLDYWEGRCAVTGLEVAELLGASHTKPWASCETDAERLDVYNGFLLAPHLDAAFDRGFLTILDDGTVMISPVLSSDQRALLGLQTTLLVRRLADEHRAYLGWHRERIFRHGH